MISVTDKYHNLARVLQSHDKTFALSDKQSVDVLNRSKARANHCEGRENATIGRGRKSCERDRRRWKSDGGNEDEIKGSRSSDRKPEGDHTRGPKERGSLSPGACQRERADLVSACFDSRHSSSEMHVSRFLISRL